MKKISWRKAKGGRAMEHLLEGYVNNELAFIIEGRLCVTDLRPMSGEVWEHPKHYMIEDRNNAKEEAKQIAFDLLNGLNVEKHEENLRKEAEKQAASLKVIQDAEEFLKKLKNGDSI